MVKAMAAREIIMVLAPRAKRKGDWSGLADGGFDLFFGCRVS